MKYFLACLACLLFLAKTAAQPPTFFQHVQPILLKNCAPCHRPGGGAPFNLLTYEDAANRASFIAHVTGQRFMPPWFAEPDFRSFHNQRILTAEEIETIRRWAEAGAPKGKKKKGLAVEPGHVLTDFPPPDLVVPMQKPFAIPGDNTEQFRIFILPTGNEEERFVSGIGFQPGNLELAHHARIMLDTTQLLRADDGTAAGDSNTQFTRLNVQLADYFWQGWVPGNVAHFYPEGVAKRLPKNTDFVLNMHYSPSPVPAADLSKVNIWLAKKPPERLVKTFILDESWIANQPFEIPPDTVITFFMRSQPLPKTISLLSVLPHMHLLGKSFRAYAITPGGNVVNLIKIERWNFKWQMTYQFERLVRLPKGSIVFAEATFDNTSANPVNPFSPPRKATYGWGTFNEMMNLIFEYLDYREGDENLPLFKVQPD